ncbi:hypothetical protein [Actinoplanes couchii]|uniref:Uncharacterized protein n=1 Tax=Actinoplanes couchii TaxID=403638 RepID=A0ABQ3XTI4_9ACTN|nr:hypothetical protein [Actinoplanes couchii]MDR6318959.1 hypothetical protein [Actinoplanes couchii]GID61808.1 hypothetical protein Aco03nite_102120 [Actinoplanes couchii]
MPTEQGKIFRNAWIAGVRQHYPDDPKPGYVTPWDDTPDWERAAAAAVYGQVLTFIEVSNGATTKLSREQRGRFIALCWIAQIHAAFDDPKPTYVADWEDLPAWQQQVDADIFDAIERHAETPEAC